MLSFFRTVSFIRHALLAVLALGVFTPKKLLAQDSRQFALKSENGEVGYVVDVWVPASYSADQRAYPVLVMLDGEYAFSSAVQLAAQLQRNREVEEFVIVGVSYGVGFGKPLAAKRTPDFTPHGDEQGVIRKTETAYYRFIRDRLLPELHARYRIDPAKRALWGYSLSGSFAAWLNYQDPALFEHTILASGNLMGFGIAEKLFQGQIFSGKGTVAAKCLFPSIVRRSPIRRYSKTAGDCWPTKRRFRDMSFSWSSRMASRTRVHGSPRCRQVYGSSLERNTMRSRHRKAHRLEEFHVI